MQVTHGDISEKKVTAALGVSGVTRGADKLFNNPPRSDWRAV